MPYIASIFGFGVELVDEAGELPPMPEPLLAAIHQADLLELGGKLVELAGVLEPDATEFDA